MAKKNKVSRKVLLGALEAAIMVNSMRELKKIRPDINALLDRQVADLGLDETGLLEEFLGYIDDLARDAAIEAAADVPKKLKKPKGKKATKKKRK
jgi:hypothetical protein